MEGWGGLKRKEDGLVQPGGIYLSVLKTEQLTFRRQAEQIDNGALGRESQKLLWEQSVL